MQDYSKLLKNKNELSQIQKKITKIQFYLARVQDDMNCIRRQAEDLMRNKREKDKLLSDKIDQINSKSHSELHHISTQLQQRINCYQDNSKAILDKLNNLKQQQNNDHLLLNTINQRIIAIQTELGVS